MTALLILCGYFFLLYQIVSWVRHNSLNELSQSVELQLNLYVTHLSGQLEKYQYLPELLSTDKRFVELLENPGDVENTETINRYLQVISEVVKAADIYLMDHDGETVAASNWQTDRPFIGKNFSFRPYFHQALQGRLGRYFALGTTSGKRGYYFASPVQSGGNILGAMVVKVDLGAIEQHWQGRKEEVMVTDPDGVVFISTHPAWHYRAYPKLSDLAQERIAGSHRYPNTQILPLPLLHSTPVSNHALLVEIGGIGDEQEDAKTGEYLMQSQVMGEAGWKVYLLMPLKVINDRMTWSLLITTFAFAAILLFGLFLIQRRKRREERARYEVKAKNALRESHDQLEQRVKTRTADLSREIEERRRAEQALRQAQDELVQTAKLAMLGQMSASISHELNQPLAAIRAYADNACLLLEQERRGETVWNLRQISELIERMAQISSQLKLFARKTDGQRRIVSLRNSIEASRSILRPQLKKTQTQIRLDIPENDVYVLADPVRLEQVLVNLLGNADLAMEEIETRWIRISTRVDEEDIYIDIHDNGPGIPESNLDKIFDPFFTTRESGLGLGLSISHHIVETMGGGLSAANHPNGGALFTLRLTRVRSAEL